VVSFLLAFPELTYTRSSSPLFVLQAPPTHLIFLHLIILIILGEEYKLDRVCGLVVRVLGYRSGGPGSIPGTTREKKVVGLERGPLSLVSTTDELLDRKVAAPI
jgi:hypothetical protein